MSEKELREKELEDELTKLRKKINLQKAQEKRLRDKFIEHNLLEELKAIDAEYSDEDSGDSMPKIATDIIEKKAKARDLKEKEKTDKDKLIERNLKEAIMKSLENPAFRNSSK